MTRQIPSSCFAMVCAMALPLLAFAGENTKATTPKKGGDDIAKALPSDDVANSAIDAGFARPD